MDFGFLRSLPWFGAKSTMDMVIISATSFVEAPKKGPSFDVKLWGLSLLSLVPWAISAREKIHMPATVNKNLKRHAARPTPRQRLDSARHANLRFRPYVSKVPWHTGARAFLSQLFPRYGHYCGPNWSSGKDGGSPVWDKRPIDWLDFCCYCHDIGYDSHDQAELLKADLAFLECLERPNMSTKGDARIAFLYRTMCISGLRNILIPYRKQLVNLKPGQFIGFGWLGNINLKGCRTLQKSPS